LLNGADITIRYDADDKLYIAHASTGTVSGYVPAAAKDPVRALGLAIMLSAGYTEETLKQELLTSRRNASED
jgi:hypothetical protein